MSFAFRKGSWLGRGLDNAAGKPFGWAWHRERDEIREHLERRLGPVKPRSWEWAMREQRVTRIQERIHKHRPTYRQRQEAARARGEKWVSPPPGPPPVRFTDEELERIAEHFERANDPLAQSIWRKAARRD